MASYYVWSGATGSANGTTWANAYTTLTLAFTGKAAGDVFYVAHDHAESTASSLTLSSLGTITSWTKVVCVNRAGSVPPVSADRRATATVSATVNSSINFNGFTHYDGIIFIAGNSTGSPTIAAPSALTISLRFDNCSLQIGSTGSGKIRIGNGGLGGTSVEFNNTTVSFAGVNQGFDVAGGLRWRQTQTALLGTIPTSLFILGAAHGGFVECIGVDLSAAGSGKAICNANSSDYCKLQFIDCKLDASVTKVAAWTYNSIDIDFLRSGATGVNYMVSSHRCSGTLTEETTIVRTGGATDGTTPIAWKVVTSSGSSGSSFSAPFPCPPIAIWCDTVGSAKTATVEGIWGGGVVPNDDDIWLEVEYLGSSSSPQGAFVNDGKAELLATAAGQTSSSATWGGSTTKFKLGVTFTAQQKGWVYARVKCAKVSSTFYIDPKVTLS